MKKPFIKLKNTSALLLIISISNCATETEGLALMTNSFKKKVEERFTELDKKDKEHDGELITQKAENNKKYSSLQEKNNILEKQLKEAKEEFEKKIKEEIEDANSENNKAIISLREERLQLKHNLETANTNLNNTSITLQKKEEKLNFTKTTLHLYKNDLKKKQEELKSNEEKLTKTLAEIKTITEELQTLKIEKINKEKIEKEIERIEKIKTDLRDHILKAKNNSKYGCIRFLVLDYLFEVLKNFIAENNYVSNLENLKNEFSKNNNIKDKADYFNFNLSNDLLFGLFEFDATLVKKKNKDPKANDKNYLAKHILCNIYCLVLCEKDKKDPKKQDGTKSIKIEKIDVNPQKYKVSLIDKTD